MDIGQRSDHRTVPIWLARPLTEALPIEDQGKDTDQGKTKANHRHCDEGILYAGGFHQGADVEWYHKRDYVSQATSERQCVSTLGKI